MTGSSFQTFIQNVHTVSYQCVYYLKYEYIHLFVLQDQF